MPSGIAGLDTVLHGGFLADNLYILTGLPGTGKTILGNQLCFHHVAAGGRALFVTALAESHAHMLSHLRSFRFLTPQAIGHQLSYLSASGELDGGGLDGFVVFLRRAIVEQQATLVVVDGWESLRPTAGSALDLKRAVHKLQVVLRSTGCTAVLLTQDAGPRPAPEHTMVDGLLRLSRRVVRQRPLRELVVTKFRGSAYLDGRHAVEITDAGIVVYPRTESLLAFPKPQAQESRIRLGFGSPGLDAMLRGGLLSGSTSLVLGSPGSGKTVLGLHFLAAGAHQGEPELYFGFYETPPPSADRQGPGDRSGLREPDQPGAGGDPVAAAPGSADRRIGAASARGCPPA